MSITRNFVLTAALVLAALAAQVAAAAQPVVSAPAENVYYQSIMPDGRLVIGDKPAPGAKEVKKMPLTQGNASAPLSSPGQTGPNPMQQGLNTATADVNDAERNLSAAKAALEAGREPRPGERIGNANGMSRFTDGYNQRLKALQDGVATAQRQLEEAYSRRNAAR